MTRGPVSLHGILEATASRLPAATAFRCRDDALSYATLLERSRRLAALLRDLGVARGDRVGILSGKTIDLPVAVYGILGAGAAYVPLDPGSPPARIDALIRDCGIRVLVSEPNRRRTLQRLEAELDAVIGVPDEAHPRHRCIDSDSLASMPAGDGFTAVDATDLAYIIYTSGSTGEPKGIMHTQASALAFAAAAAETYGLEPSDRLSNFPPLHFDQSIFDFFSGPLAGATTVLIPEDVMRFPASLAGLIERERLTVWYSVPMPLIGMLVAGVLEGRDLSSVRWILYGGEAFPPKYLRELMRLFPSATLSNVYGPAETNQCTFFNVATADEIPDAGLPVGPAWPSASLRVVDPADVYGEPVREGELLVSSPTLMRGYWGGRFPEVFVDIEEDGLTQRYYRTGDIVRDDDGVLFFLGRRDRMIKSRGQRVELDEIESVLNGLAGVSEAAVYAVVADDGAAEIRAAVIGDEEQVDARSLSRSLQALLPAAAIPARFAFVDEFPRTASGKVDRRALEAL